MAANQASSSWSLWPGRRPGLEVARSLAWRMRTLPGQRSRRSQIVGLGSCRHPHLHSDATTISQFGRIGSNLTPNCKGPSSQLSRPSRNLVAAVVEILNTRLLDYKLTVSFSFPSYIHSHIRVAQCCSPCLGAQHPPARSLVRL